VILTADDQQVDRVPVVAPEIRVRGAGQFFDVEAGARASPRMIG
jgi:hypothetical protein